MQAGIDHGVVHKGDVERQLVMIEHHAKALMTEAVDVVVGYDLMTTA